MNCSALYKLLKEDLADNWANHSIGEFELFVYRNEPQAGSRLLPLGESSTLDKKNGQGFVGLPETWVDQLILTIEKFQAEILDKFTSDEMNSYRVSHDNVRIVIWDEHFKWPCVLEGVSRARGKTELVKPSSPFVASLSAEERDEGAGDFVIVIPYPRRWYWGEDAIEWMKGALRHEMMHVVNSWVCGAKGMSWAVLDESLAVWSERHVDRSSRSQLDYAGQWTQQCGISLYGVNGSSCTPLRTKGYQLFPFLDWLSIEKGEGVVFQWMKAIGEKGAGQVDVYGVLADVLKDTDLGEFRDIYSDYCKVLLTSGFRENHLPCNCGEGVRKIFEQVFCPVPNQVIRQDFRLHILAKRGVVIKNSEEVKGVGVSIQTSTTDIGFHLFRSNSDKCWDYLGTFDANSNAENVDFCNHSIGIVMFRYGLLRDIHLNLNSMVLSDEQLELNVVSVV